MPENKRMNNYSKRVPRNLGKLIKLRSNIKDKTPLAFFSESGSISVYEFDILADNITAELFNGFNIGLKNRVMIISKTSPLQMAALCACWTLGAIACPVDTFIKPVKLSLLMKQFKPDLVLLDQRLEDFSELRIICQKEEIKSISLGSLGNFKKTNKYAAVHLSENDPALCIFTSGSTGNPKGVLLSHLNLLIGAENVIKAKNLKPSDRVLCVLPLSHLNGLITTFITPLLSGGSVVYLEGPFESRKALSLIDKYQCTWFSGVPMHYATLMKPALDKKIWPLNTLRFCRSASAPLSPQIIKDFEEHYGVPIIETMGMTETSGQIFSNPLPPEIRKPGSVGKPVGFDISLVDEGGNECADNVLGEIRIKGIGVMLGYIDDAAETSIAYDGEWLKSGDLAIRDSEGYYYIHGRKKDIAIFSGVNISLRYIEDSVREHNLVKDIACIGEADYYFSEKIIAYVVPKAEDKNLPDTTSMIKKILYESLPNEQALKEIRFVSEFPCSQVGKVIKDQLRSTKIIYTSLRFIPDDPKEILSEVVNLPLESIHDDLGLGLVKNWDSLTHMALILAAEVKLGRVLNDFEMIAMTTVKGFARVLKEGILETDNVNQILSELGCINYSSGITSEQTREKIDLVSLMTWNNAIPGLPGTEKTEMPRRNLGSRRGKTSFLTFEELTAALRKSGLAPGDVVMLHADVTTMGMTVAGYKREDILAFYLSAFQKVLTEEGTLVMCTSFEDYARYDAPFIHEESPSRLGALSEYIRVQPGTIRSLHPIVSVSSLGNKAKEISEGNHFEGFGYDSPFGRLHRMNAKLMTFGMWDYPQMGLTFLHYIEHLYGVPYQYTKLYNTPVYSKGEKVEGTFTMSVRYLDYGITYDNVQFRDYLVEQGIASHVPVGRNAIFCITSNDIIEKAVERLAEDRYYFLLNPPTFRAGEIPMDGSTGNIGFVYDKGIK